MNRFIAGSLMGLLMINLAGALGAEEAMPAQDVGKYLSDLQVKLDHAAQRANQPTSSGSSVIGLRGSKQESASKQLYWKGVQGDETVNPEEVKTFRAAVESARAGKKADAVTALQNFQKTYPKSALLPDVKETLQRLSAADVPAATATVAPAAATATSIPAHS